MSSKRFWIDWQDAAFPEIKPMREGLEDLVEPMTFTEAKAEIVRHLTKQVAHAREVIADIRALRIADIDPDAR
jgi:hypothetical protein